MKTVVLAFFVLLAVNQSEALRCKCGGVKHCPSSVETCSHPQNACASVIIHAGSSVNYFQSCLNLQDCLVLNRPGISYAYCCRTDLCN